MKSDLLSRIQSFAKKTTNKIDEVIVTKITKDLYKLGEDTANKLREYTYKWYDNYFPKDYQRTQDLINSITFKVDKLSVYIYFDTSKIRSIERRLSGNVAWNAHMGFDGEDFTKGLIEWIEDDANSGSKSNPRRNHQGVKMIQNTQQWLRGYLDKETQRIIKEAYIEVGIQ